MSSLYVSNWKQKADEYSKVIIKDQEREKYFLDGVKWTIDALEYTIRNSGCHLADASTNANLHKYTMSDVNKFIKEMKEFSK